MEGIQKTRELESVARWLPKGVWRYRPDMRTAQANVAMKARNYKPDIAKFRRCGALVNDAFSCNRRGTNIDYNGVSDDPVEHLGGGACVTTSGNNGKRECGHAAKRGYECANLRANVLPMLLRSMLLPPVFAGVAIVLLSCDVEAR